MDERYQVVDANGEPVTSYRFGYIAEEDCAERSELPENHNRVLTVIDIRTGELFRQYRNGFEI